MQIINSNKKKEMVFEVHIDGINYTELTGSLRFIIDGVEYGFPAMITEKNISVIIPPLKNIVKKLPKNETVDCKLEVFGDGFFMNPWNEKVKITSPVIVEAKLKEQTMKNEKGNAMSFMSSNEREPIIKVKPTTFESEEDVEEQINEPESNYMPEPPESNSEKEAHKKAMDKVDEMIDALNFRKPIKKTIPKKKIVSENKKIVKKQTQKKKIVSKPKDLDMNALMESVGMKNERIKQIMLEKVEAMGSTPEEKYVALESLLGLRMNDPFSDKLMKKFSIGNK